MNQINKESNDLLVSIIVPVYQVEEYLGRCLDSLLNQTYQNIEIILVDDGSLDNSPKICDKYGCLDKRVKVIHQPNGGVSHARNVGVSKANGQYLTFVDSDDYVKENYIEKLTEPLGEKKYSLVIGQHEIEYGDEEAYPKYAQPLKGVYSGKECLDLMLYDEGIDVSCWCKLYRKDLFENVSYPEGQLFEDAAITPLLIAKADEIRIIDDVIYVYHIRSKSITTSLFDKGKMDLITSTKGMCDDIVSIYPDLAQGCKRREMFAYCSTLSQLANSTNQKEFKQERDFLMKYIKENRNEVLKDERLPKRDRLGLTASKFGYRVYCLAWKGYQLIRH